MDPLGFALENFDGIGGWRTVSEAGKPLDVTGRMPNGVAFTGLSELRAYLLNEHEAFVGTLVEKLLVYAIGRGLEHFDRPTVRQIMRASAEREYRWTAIILGIVQSPPFQMRQAAERTASGTASRG
jgi:hypothetical protein